MKDYRLHEVMAYFKLIAHALTDMIKVMYIPLEYQEALLASPGIVGGQGVGHDV